MRILIATDGSSYSDAAVRSVGARSWPSDTEFLIFSVAEPLLTHIDPMFVPYQNYAIENLRTQHQEFVEHAKRALEKRHPHCSIAVAITDGSAGEEIVQKAKEWSADFIVVGSHGRKGLEKFLLGSVAEFIVSRAHCSVEVVKLPPAGNMQPSVDHSRESARTR